MNSVTLGHEFRVVRYPEDTILYIYTGLSNISVLSPSGLGWDKPDKGSQ